MHLGLRLLFGFFAITGLAVFVLLRVALVELDPAVREATESVLVDAAHLLAEQTGAELAAMPPGGTLAAGALAASLKRYRALEIDAPIFAVRKRSLDFGLYVTDASGRVVLAEAPPGGDAVLGADYSRWRDVARTLRGEYGARVSRLDPADPGSTVIYVAAPVRHEGRTVGVLTVARSGAALQRSIDEARRRVMVAAAWLLGAALALGVAVTLWTVHSVRRLRRYALDARVGEATPVPRLPGELGELAHAMASMRERLEGRDHLEQSMRALTHELKTPLTAIAGAAELLHDPLTTPDREAFAGQIAEQVARLQSLVEQLLELSKLEGPRPPGPLAPVVPLRLLQSLVGEHSARLRQRCLTVQWGTCDTRTVDADEPRLRMALTNLLANAIDFAPAGSALELAVAAAGERLRVSVRDHGPGVPLALRAHLGERFYSTARPDGRRGSGLGLAIARQVALRHGGQLVFEDAGPGLRATLALPLHRRP